MGGRFRAVLWSLVSVLVCSTAVAQGPPPGWGQQRPLPPANGVGQVTFKQGATTVTLPLNKIEIQTPQKDMLIVSLAYVDPKQENSLSGGAAS